MQGVSAIGVVISELRKKKGVTQEEVAKYVGVSPQAVSKWENGGVPDTELLVKIADFFEVSIDFLFGRSYLNYDIATAISEDIKKHGYLSADGFHEALELCWIIERAFFMRLEKQTNSINFKENTISDYEKRLPESAQTYSYIESDYGFTRVGIANQLQYFLLVSEIKNKEQVLFEGIDYTEFFAFLSEKDVFQALILLYKRDHRKSFTENLFVRELSVDVERAKQIIQILKKINLVTTRKLELDDETLDIFTFVPNTAFVALLIFAREIIDRPSWYSYQQGYRTKPYLA